MGRRKKADILENPQAFDFEIRPREIIPVGFENEAITKLSDLLGKFNIQNPLLTFVVATEEACFFRFDVEQTIEPLQDIIGRPIGEPTLLRLRVQTSCGPLETPLQEAYLFTEDGPKDFNGWADVEVEYKGEEDPRLRKALKYP